MNIIIAGAGKVGFHLAKTLSIGHNVTIIDKNAEALHRIQESLDILPMEGNVEDSKIYECFMDKEVDLFIAVTNVDNVNIISTLMAESVLDIKRKFVRLQKHFFADTMIKNRLQIDEMIFPIKLASKAIVTLLNFPRANNVKFFTYTDYRLISVRISKNFEASLLESKDFIIVGIERKKSFFIPQENQEIIANDLVYFYGDEETINALSVSLEQSPNTLINRCVVFGGGELGVFIAKELLKEGKDVKLIEKNLQLCEEADEILEGKVSVINSKYGTESLFEDEGLTGADVFISATNNDEYNIVKCLEAQEHGISKVVAINNEMEYYSLMHSLGITVVRGPKMSAYNAIMEQINSTGVIIEKRFCGSRASVFMRRIFFGSKLINKKIKPLNVNSSLLFFMRDHQLFPFKEKVILQESDLIVAFSSLKENHKIKQWIYEL